MTTQHPTLKRTLHHLRRPLAPLVSITTGTSHPSFPPTLLHYHLLTAAELDVLAHYYHQRTPSEHSFGYPLPVLGRWHAPSSCAPSSPTWSTDATASCFSPSSSSSASTTEQNLLQQVGIIVSDGVARDEKQTEAKRRRFGRFCGLRGCESPGMEEGDEDVMRVAMEEWVKAGWRRGEERAMRECVGRGKGCW